MYLCESCGLWINCSIHHNKQWSQYLNNYDIRHDCPRRCQEVCLHTMGFQHQQGWNYYKPLLESPPGSFQPFAVAPDFNPTSNWSATSSSLSIGSVGDNYFR